MPIYSLPSASFDSVQQFLRQKRATGQTVSPTEERSAWGGYWDAQARYASIDRHLALEERRQRILKNQYDERAEAEEGAARIKGITELGTSLASIGEVAKRGTKSGGAQKVTADTSQPAAPVNPPSGMQPKAPLVGPGGPAPSQPGPSNASAFGQIESGALSPNPATSEAATATPGVGLNGLPSASSVAQGLGAVGMVGGLVGGPIGAGVAAVSAVASAAVSIGSAVYGGIASIVGTDSGTSGGGDAK